MNDLHELLEDAVADVEPADRLAEIQARTSGPAHAARPWWWAAAGVVAATAATVAAFAVLGGDGGSDTSHHHDDHLATSPTETQLVAAYFVGPSAGGDRLFREFDEVSAGDPLDAALDRIQRPADDPDYRTPWPRGSFETARLDDGTIVVEVGDGNRVDPQPDRLPVQQLVYTLQAAAGHRLPVQLVRSGEPVGDPVTAEPQLDVLNPVSISDPAEGTAYSGTFTARGRASSFEATVPWELRDEAGRVVLKGSATASGWLDRLYPWSARIDVSELPDGFYTFVAMTDDPTGGTEGSGPASDTRTIIVR